MSRSIDFFETQFRRPASDADVALNPFEAAALPFLHGDVLDFGCGLGNLALAAAARGCRVVALDGAPTAIARLRLRAAEAGLAIDAVEADLRDYRIEYDFDAVVAIGLLMFFDCDTAQRQLAALREQVRPGGVAVVNVLTVETTYLEMFDPHSYCLFARDALRLAFAGWAIEHESADEFAAPGGTRKCFATVIARRPVRRFP